MTKLLISGEKISFSNHQTFVDVKSLKFNVHPIKWLKASPAIKPPTQIKVSLSNVGNFYQTFSPFSPRAIQIKSDVFFIVGFSSSDTWNPFETLFTFDKSFIWISWNFPSQNCLIQKHLRKFSVLIIFWILPSRVINHWLVGEPGKFLFLLICYLNRSLSISTASSTREKTWKAINYC